MKSITIKLISLSIVFLIYSCKTHKNGNLHNTKENIKLHKKEIFFLDSLFVGATFKKFNTFKGYNFIEAEPYDIIANDSKMNSTQMVLYKKEKTYYIAIVTADKLIDLYDYDWEKVDKTVKDIISFDVSLDYCWYPNIGSIEDAQGYGYIGIGEKKNKKTINESDYDTYINSKIWKAKYEEGKFVRVEKKQTSFLCSEGY